MLRLVVGARIEDDSQERRGSEERESNVSSPSQNNSRSNERLVNWPLQRNEGSSATMAGGGGVKKKNAVGDVDDRTLLEIGAGRKPLT